jgi:hypothetical protein
LEICFSSLTINPPGQRLLEHGIDNFRQIVSAKEKPRLCRMHSGAFVAGLTRLFETTILPIASSKMILPP